MNIFKSQSNESVFCFTESEDVAGFIKIGDFSGEWGFTLPSEVLDIMIESSPSIVKWEAPVQPSRTASMLELDGEKFPEEEFAGKEPQIIGYSYTVVES